MKYSLFILAAVLVFFTSCEKVIHIDLNTAAPQYVIEADLIEGTHPFRVHVAKTTDYFGVDPQQQVGDAVVTLTEQAGASVTIPFSANGWYELPSYTAVSGKSYTLKVVSGGKDFTAVSSMPFPISIDSMSYEYKDENEGFGDPGYEVAGYFNDPVGVNNYYRVILTVNDTLLTEPEDLYLFKDKFNNGKLVKVDIFDRYQTGEKIHMEVRGMDESVFQFYTTLNDALNNQGGPAPANPISNFTNGAMGYFGAFTSSEKELIIP
jgi:hypothetical protein